MTSTLRSVFLGILSAIAISHAQDPRIQYAEPGFVSLFNGTTLPAGMWDHSPIWSVSNGEITGTGPVNANEYLIYKHKKYHDFILKVKLILVDNHGNSGIHFRSRYLEGRPYYVGGYQADIGWDEGTVYSVWAKLIYWVENGNPSFLKFTEPTTDCLNSIHKDNTWNDFAITAKGAQMKVEMNGFVCNEYTETDAGRLRDSGYIALQMHNGDNMKVKFRDIRIKDLSDSSATVLRGHALAGKSQPAYTGSRAMIFRSKESQQIISESQNASVRLNGQRVIPHKKNPEGK